MKKNKTIFIIILIGILIYYVIPCLSFGMDSELSYNYGNICIYFINSIYALLSGILIKKDNRFKWYYSFIVGILFIPSSLIYYNKTTVVYFILYILEFIIGFDLIKYNN